MMGMKIGRWPLGVFVAITIMIFLTDAAMAAPALDFSIHQPYVSTRALGMGNAFAAVADDHSAMFYNPAGLARREDGNLHFFLRGAIDPSILKLADDISKTDKNGSESEQITNMVNLLVEQPSQRLLKHIIRCYLRLADNAKFIFLFKCKLKTY